MTTATQPTDVERYRRMVDIVENVQPEEAYKRLADGDVGDFKPYYELVVSKDAEASYNYACYVIKGRWEKGEAVISQYAEASYYYARDVIKGRWEKGEDVISQYAGWSYRYALNVIKGRWEQGEGVISQDKEMLVNYAFNVIKGRLPEHLEKILLSDEDSL